MNDSGLFEQISVFNVSISAHVLRNLWHTSYKYFLSSEKKIVQLVVNVTPYQPCYWPINESIFYWSSYLYSTSLNCALFYPGSMLNIPNTRTKNIWVKVTTNPIILVSFQDSVYVLVCNGWTKLQILKSFKILILSHCTLHASKNGEQIFSKLRII